MVAVLIGLNNFWSFLVAVQSSLGLWAVPGLDFQTLPVSLGSYFTKLPRNMMRKRGMNSLRSSMTTQLAKGRNLFLLMKWARMIMTLHGDMGWLWLENRLILLIILYMVTGTQWLLPLPLGDYISVRIVLGSFNSAEFCDYITEQVVGSITFFFQYDFMLWPFLLAPGDEPISWKPKLPDYG